MAVIKSSSQDSQEFLSKYQGDCSGQQLFNRSHRSSSEAQSVSNCLTVNTQCTRAYFSKAPAKAPAMGQLSQREQEKWAAGLSYCLTLGQLGK